jgi:small subunit ribosomal protein S1
MKQLGNDPWVDLVERYPEGTQLNGRVTNITDYGCFVEIEEGVEGLVHMSEMDWTNKNIHPSKVVQLGDKVDVMILEVDQDRRRISLGMKQCIDNPWTSFEKQFARGQKVTGKIRSITDFGIFIGLSGEIDGLVHLSDISWSLPGEEAVKAFKKGQEVETVILAIDSDRERISLGIKQLENDPFSNYVEQNPKGSVVSGTVSEVTEKEVTVDIAEEVVGTIRASELSATDKVEDARDAVKVGETIEARIVNVDRKTRVLVLSVKAKDAKEQAEVLKKYSAGANEKVGGATLGDLLKEKMSGQGE